jgi:type II secretory pathway pseudopilin PulG
MKRIHSFFVVLIVVLVFVASFFLVRYSTADSINQNKWQSETALSYLRDKIRQYHQVTGEFPSSLAEMENYFVRKTGERWGPSMEYISAGQGSKRESAVLDGSGGWYYSRETGELRINLTGPLKSYFRYYYRQDRNEQPCDW